MGASTRLRANDIAGVFELLEECRDLWADASAWQHHLLAGGCRLTGMAVGTYTESYLSTDRASTVVYDEADHGWRDDEARSYHLRFLEEHPNRVASLPRVYRVAGRALDEPTGEASAVRNEIRADNEWYLSAAYNEYFRPAGIDGFVMSFGLNRRTGNLVTVYFSQDASDRPPGARQRQIVSLLTTRLAPMVGVSLATYRQRGWHGLAPRLRQTLQAMLAGDSEKQIAVRLGLRAATVHEYVTALYRHFGVASRGELMAYFLRRTPLQPEDGCETQLQ